MTDSGTSEWVVYCERPGHPVRYAHAHPYISALCARNSHTTCTAIGQMADYGGFCDCTCHASVSSPSVTEIP